MDIFDKFFTKFAYKFDKGYPDMNNEQDIALLESLLSEVLGEKFYLKEGADDVKTRKELIDKNPGFFDTQSDSRRIANKKKIWLLFGLIRPFFIFCWFYVFNELFAFFTTSNFFSYCSFSFCFS